MLKQSDTDLCISVCLCVHLCVCVSLCVRLQVAEKEIRVTCPGHVNIAMVLGHDTRAHQANK